MYLIIQKFCLLISFEFPDIHFLYMNYVLNTGITFCRKGNRLIAYILITS
jgi:hypothetical protein